MVTEEQSSRAKASFAQASRFLKARNRVIGVGLNNPEEFELIYPMLTLEAFAIELFLKSLIIQQGEEPPKSHNLGKLFRMLHPNTKRMLVDKWEAGPRQKLAAFGHSARMPTDLPNALNICGDGFQELRYAFENPEKVRFYLGDLPKLLFDAIAERHSNWVVWTD